VDIGSPATVAIIMPPSTIEAAMPKREGGTSLAAANSAKPKNAAEASPATNRPAASKL